LEPAKEGSESQNKRPPVKPDNIKNCDKNNYFAATKTFGLSNNTLPCKCEKENCPKQPQDL